MSKTALDKHYEQILVDSKNDKNCCVPLAISVVTEKNYEEIDSQLKELKLRKKNHGVTLFNYQSFIQKDLNLELRDITKEVLDLGGQTIKSIEKVCIKGKFIIDVRKHALALVDGKVYDYTRDKRSRVRRVLTITPKEDIKLVSIAEGIQKKINQRKQMEDDLILALKDSSIKPFDFNPSGKWVKVSDIYGNSMLMAKRDSSYHIAITPNVENGIGRFSDISFNIGRFKNNLGGVEGKKSKSYTLFVVNMDVKEILKAFFKSL